MGGNTWTILMAPEGGWKPHWKEGMIVLVVLGSCVLALMVSLIVSGVSGVLQSGEGTIGLWEQEMLA